MISELQRISMTSQYAQKLRTQPKILMQTHIVGGEVRLDPNFKFGLA